MSIRQHPFRRHRWHAVSVDWSIVRNESTVAFVCRNHSITRTYPGLLTIEAARLIRSP